MNEEQHRRLCGNDVGVLIYFDVTDKSLLPPLPGGTSSDVVREFSIVAHFAVVPH